jgi:alkaline phosphatase D
MAERMTRREVLRLLGVGVPGAYVLGACAVEAAPDGPLPVHDDPDPAPFRWGVASGDPMPGASTIWTRVEAPPGSEVGVLWMVAEDASFDRVVAAGTVTATDATGHAVTVPVGDLPTDAWLWYRFEALGGASRTGRLRTAPAPGTASEHLRFAFSSCQQLNESFFVAHQAAAAEPGVDFMVHLGDYIYVDDAATLTLADYRGCYDRWRREPGLRDLHAAYPMVAVWDDGEFVNGVDRTLSPERFDNATRAWFEWFPHVDPGGRRTYRNLRWGTLVDLPVLDVRSYRDPAVDSIVYLDGNEAYDPVRTTLGSDQYGWLTTLLAGSDAAWRIIGSGYNVAPWRLLNLEVLRPFVPGLPPNAGIYAPNEAWDDYFVERRDLLEWLGERSIVDTVFVSGHTHVYLASDLRPDPDSWSSPVVAADFCTGSLTADPDPRAAFLPGLRADVAEEVIRLAERWVLSQNAPGMRHINLVDQGYAVVDVDPERIEVTYRLIDTSNPDAEPVDGAQFRVRRGVPGLEVLPTAGARGSFGA